MASAFTADASNYWTITARLRRMDAAQPQTIGELLGSYSTRYRSLVAQAEVPLYSNAQGAPFHESDRLVVTAAATGSPGALVGAVAWAQLARSVG